VVFNSGQYRRITCLMWGRLRMFMGELEAVVLVVVVVLVVLLVVLAVLVAVLVLVVLVAVLVV